MSSIRLPGRCLDEAGAERDCTLRGDTPEVLEITVGRALVPGERLVCGIPGLGLLTGRAAGPAEGAFRFAVEAGSVQRDRLAACLAWHAARAAGAQDRREAVRVAPIQTEVHVTWDGAEVRGRLRDVSASGASVDLVPRPGIGTPITIGRRRGHVVRHTEAGIGVRFVLPLSPYDVTEAIFL